MRGWRRSIKATSTQFFPGILRPKVKESSRYDKELNDFSIISALLNESTTSRRAKKRRSHEKFGNVVRKTF